jgi:LacI family transcriptional regulator
MSLRHIATALGLSVTTVSRALADYADVADETRRRVRAEAERIGYVPNVVARRLQKGRLDAIGVAAPSGPGAMEDSYLYSSFVGAWSRLAELGQDLVLLPMGDNTRGTVPEAKAGQAFNRAIEERRVDGVILVRARREDPRISALQRAGLPFVVLGAVLQTMPEVVAIGTDDKDAAAQVCDRLQGFGHDALTCVAPDGDLDFSQSRLESLEAEAARRNMKFDRVLSYMAEDGGRAATEAILKARNGRPPSVLVYLTNRMAIGGLTALAASSLVPGRDVSVISFGDSASLQFGKPATTVIQAPSFDMARHAVDVLLALRDSRPIEPIRSWKTTLIPRESDSPRHLQAT